MLIWQQFIRLRQFIPSIVHREISSPAQVLTWHWSSHATGQALLGRSARRPGAGTGKKRGQNTGFPLRQKNTAQEPETRRGHMLVLLSIIISVETSVHVQTRIQQPVKRILL
jgi:hypothetical protein